MKSDKSIEIEKSITVMRPANELYEYWVRLENLPRIMDHVKEIRSLGGNKWHWVVKAPLGRTVEWDAQTVEMKASEKISWRSLKDSEVPNEGSVNFFESTGKLGTVIKVQLSYEPPAGAIGDAFAKMFGENPSQQIESDLKRFKQLMETGEIATTQGQTSGRKAAN